VRVDFLASSEVSPYLELGAYEWLWLNSARSYTEIGDVFRRAPGLLPSEIVNADDARTTAERAVAQMQRSGVQSFSVRVHGSIDYPGRLRDTQQPVELLYCQGWTDLLDAPRSVAVVGTREINEKGARRTKKLVELLVEKRCVIVSGLDRGVATLAHETALAHGGATIAVLPMPLSASDPRTDVRLRRQLAAEALIVSAVPALAWETADERSQKMHMIERGRIMSALTEATIIVQAGAVSSAVGQAEFALRMGRKVFILNGCFEQPGVTWPARLEATGAVRVRSFDQIARALRR
jgi:DNA processing protein